ncbi:MAG TPA: hypothetical protein VIJ87_07620 [Pyrinomonadaceae bacterium]
MTTLEIAQRPQEVSLIWVAGDALRFTLTIVDPDPDSPDPENPVMIPRNLTGYVAASQIRKNAKPDSVLLAEFEFNTLDGSGVIAAYLSPDESEKLRGTNSASWDLQLTDPEGDPLTLMAGPAKPSGDVTR